MKVLFMGTPAFAAVCLDKLILSSHTVVGVVTQPDRALKRGKTELSPVKKLALDAGIAVFQPERLNAGIGDVASLGADIGVTAAYGQLLNGAVLSAFRKGVINVHASVLPKYRGASPVQSAILNGEKETGVTIMKTELGLDCGDILSVVRTEIGERETGGQLMARLAELGGELLIKTLDNYDGITPVPQEHGSATHCRTIKKCEEYIDFCRSSADVDNLIRALCPAPCAKTVIAGEVYKIYEAEPIDGCGAPGEITECSKRLVIACGSGAISVKTIQAPGKRALDIDDFLRGRSLPVGAVCGKQE